MGKLRKGQNHTKFSEITECIMDDTVPEKACLSDI
jgi:hypothetical protein